jgi:tRNA-specific 2-thiouridylase
LKIAVAMSGGIDSSVAAALLKEEGHDLIGLTMQIGPFDESSRPRFGGCCGTDEIEDARKAARHLGVPHYVIDFRDIFSQTVFDDFCREYRRGRTPNPCVRCNRYVKFAALLEKARGLGCQVLATGHYARIERDSKSGRYLLKKGADPAKDQSYFLCQLTRKQLARARFPVGGLTKAAVRRIAGEMNLPVADRPESQEICFIPNEDYPAFLRNYIPEACRPGPIIDAAGNTLGEHQGIPAYTIGQRRGLGIAAAEPLYVTAIEPERNAVVVGTKNQTYARELTASGLNWMAPAPENTGKLKARIRYRHPEVEATVTPVGDDTVRVRFREPQMAITPGQTVAFYDGDRVIGGGTIMSQGK